MSDLVFIASSLIITFLLFNTLARLPILTACFIASLRVTASYLYFPVLFPASDQTQLYWPYILDGNCADFAFNFTSFASSLHCFLGVDSLQIINLSYGLLGSFFYCLCFRIFIIPTNQQYGGFRQPVTTHIWSYKLIVLLATCDPASLLYFFIQKRPLYLLSHSLILLIVFYSSKNILLIVLCFYFVLLFFFMIGPTFFLL